jgi:hypothetical protein
MAMDNFTAAMMAARAIIKAFENPGGLPVALPHKYFRLRSDVPCRRWSRRNQIHVFKMGFTDARTFKEWQSVSRSPKVGERAFCITAPIICKRTDSNVAGFRKVPVFGYEQTDGDLLPADEEERHWVEDLPLIEVARSWGISVRTFDARTVHLLGMYNRNTILLGVQNLSTWGHELMHAAHDRLRHRAALRPHWRSEVIAELGGSVLLRLLGEDFESDLAGCLRYVRLCTIGEGLDAADACRQVVEQVCASVALILDTDEAIRQRPDFQRGEVLGPLQATLIR